MAIAFRWTDDGVMVPLHPKLADKAFVCQRVYMLEEEQPRNMAQHRAFFAGLRDLWLTLPEHLAEEFPSPEALRARALIEAGYCTTRQIDAGSKAAAERVAAYVQGEKPFAAVVTRGSMVVIVEPESQSVKQMGAERFKQSVEAVERVIAGLIGVTPHDIQENAA